MRRGKNPPPPSPLHPQIPEETVIEEILPRLPVKTLLEIVIEEIVPRHPVKSLLRFRCVSKSWLKQIESDRFVEIQLKNSAENPTLERHRAILEPRTYKTGLVDCSLQSLLSSNPNPNSEKGFSPHHPNPKPKPCQFVGCCNGVVCVYSHPGRFFLWNPATRASVKLPQTDQWSTTRKFGFGRDERSGAYKVFASHHHACNLYDSNNNSWRTLPYGARRLESGLGQFLRGKLHWVTYFDSANYTDYVESFDLGSEEYGRIELPFDTMHGGGTYMGECGGCLSVLVRYDKRKLLHLWVMKEGSDGVKGSWFKLLALSFDVCQCSYIYAFTPLFGGTPNGEVFMIYRDTFLVYSPGDDVLSGPVLYITRPEAKTKNGPLNKQK